MKAIPISSEQRPRDMIRSLRTASDALRQDDIVCIFAEGQITRTGQLLPFRRGLERIMKGVDAPIIPVNLDGVWGSIFSFERGRFLWKMPRRIPYPVTVSFGQPMPPTSTAIAVRRAVQELQAEAFEQRKRRMTTLDRAFVHTARRFPLRFMMADGKTPRVSFGSALTKAIYIARRLRPLIGERQMVGMLLPPSVGGALTNYALMMLGRIAVNLNYTASSEVIASCAIQCNVDVVITSKAFVERFPKLEIPGRTVFLEDALQSPRLVEKIVSIAIAWFLPQGLLRLAIGTARSARKSNVDDLATIIFSSGSTGDPKGVMLTHFNISSNIQQVSQVFMLGGRDKILGILPFFHSFGFMAALWMPAVNGVGVVYHPTGCESDRRIGGQLQSHLPDCHADLSASLHAALFTGEFWQSAICSGRRGKTAGACRARL
jgi:acyl-[acyl-carrier-protein]-phospholipid O-acyltransferase/long-chain-fatty-acid--[acyl-carrier-protein] ligase